MQLSCARPWLDSINSSIEERLENRDEKSQWWKTGIMRMLRLKKKSTWLIFLGGFGVYMAIYIKKGI